MNALVGYTGFVGSNIYACGKINRAYNTKNISESYGTAPELLIYAGLRAEKYLANSAPDRDMALIRQAEENIRLINPKKLVLISTIDVFKDSCGVDENSCIDTSGLQPYGLNRYRLETWAREIYPDALIIRLPGLFGKNIKKNFIYDFMNVIPFMLKQEKYAELSAIEPKLNEYYSLQDNGFYKVHINEEDKACLKEIFGRLGFSAINFTDSRSVYQFYDLRRLWNDIQTALENDLFLLHTATEPVSTSELYEYLTGNGFVNELNDKPAVYDYRTVYSGLFGSKDGYLCDKGTVMREIKEFVSDVHD